MFRHGLNQHSLEGLIITVLLQKRQVRHRPVDRMVHITTRSSTRLTWHRSKLANTMAFVKVNCPRPLFFPRRTGLL